MCRASYDWEIITHVGSMCIQNDKRMLFPTSCFGKSPRRSPELVVSLNKLLLDAGLISLATAEGHPLCLAILSTSPALFLSLKQRVPTLSTQGGHLAHSFLGWFL